MGATVVASLVVLTPRAAVGQAAEQLEYRPPVDAPIVDGFRVPEHQYGPGNRGIDYAATPGAPVRAAAAGEVVFAGQVGGTLHVVVLHGDGLRTTYSFLAEVSVRRGEAVAAGHVVGSAAGSLHFGVRDGDDYIDPLSLLGGRVRYQLLPDEDIEAEPIAVERARLAELLRRLPVLGSGIARSADWLRAESEHSPLRGWLHYGKEFATPITIRVGAAVASWREQSQHCTAGEVMPVIPLRRRRAVLVAGLASTSNAAAVHDVRTSELGYAPDDVSVFSYRGGTTAEQRYESRDTQVDIELSGRRLHELVTRLAGAHPDVPVDLLSHSQGGLVARVAAVSGAPASLVVTLGTPHSGADLATAGAMINGSPLGDRLRALVRAGDPALNVASGSIAQMAETSSFIRDLRARPLPPTSRFLSVAARGDLVVPALRSYLPGADNVVVHLPGAAVNDHARLPGSAEATREIALSLAGLPPTCQSLANVLSDHFAATSVGLAEDSLGASLTAVGYTR